MKPKAVGAWSLGLGLGLGLAGMAWADPMRPLGGGKATGASSSRAGNAGTPGVMGGIGGLRGTPPPPSAAASSAAEGGDAAPPPASPPPPEASRLVALRQDSLGEWHALYDGRWLRKGDRLDAPPAEPGASAPALARTRADNVTTVALVDSHGLQLRTGRKTEQVFLLPQLQPTVVPPPAAAASAVSTSAAPRARPTRAARSANAQPNRRSPPAAAPAATPTDSSPARDAGTPRP